MTADRSAAPWATTARDLYLVAMAVFLVTIVIGILNGADAVEFDRNQLLTHVHSGTVGWLSLTIVASTFLLLRAADRRLMLTLAVLVPVYVVAFTPATCRSAPSPARLCSPRSSGSCTGRGSRIWQASEPFPGSRSCWA